MKVKMIGNQREKGVISTQEGGGAPTTSSSLWTGLRNPRIVRVSRAFGGKDRHSKVTTVRGLRDRRVRLSVPTAIQLYDLQDRLGLNQPSKVVDWLINATQHEIDKLPPLQIPQGGFTQFSQSGESPPPQARSCSSIVKSYSNKRGPSLMSTESDIANGKEPFDFQRLNQSSAPSFLGNTSPYASYYQRESAANAYLSQVAMQPTHSGQAPGVLNATSQSQIVFCPPAMMPTMFQPYVAAPVELSMKQIANLQMAGPLTEIPESNLEINSLHGSLPSRPFN